MANPKHVKLLKQGAEIWNSWREANKETTPELYRADLSGADFRLDGLDLSHADLRRVDLSGSYIRHWRLRFANLFHANLCGAHITDSDLSHADLRKVNFSNARVERSNFDSATTYHTIFADVDLSLIQGLETIDHLGPSEISISTIFLSGGEIPDVFLRGCGVPEAFIVQIPSLVAALQPIQFYSCFISYSHVDHEFARRLHADLQARGVRCWFAPQDMKIGDRIRQRIDEVIRIHDRLLLVLSQNSVASSWVEKEVSTAMESEDEQKRTILFPVRLDDSVMNIKTGWPADIRRTRHIGDFCLWKEHDQYKTALAKLLSDLSIAGASKIGSWWLRK